VTKQFLIKKLSKAHTMQYRISGKSVSYNFTPIHPVILFPMA